MSGRWGEPGLCIRLCHVGGIPFLECTIDRSNRRKYPVSRMHPHRAHHIYLAAAAPLRAHFPFLRSAHPLGHGGKNGVAHLRRVVVRSRPALARAIVPQSTRPGDGP